MLDTTWFLSQPVDYEHKQYLLLAFLQKIDKEFERDKIDPALFDIKRQLSNIECFLTTKSLVPAKGNKLSAKELERIKWFESLHDKSEEAIEVNKIVKWSFKKLQEKYKEGAHIWKKVESAINMFYIGDVPDKISAGYIFIRYGGSHVTEVYEFMFNFVKNKLEIDLMSYEEKNYDDIRETIMEETKIEAPVFIGIESLQSFDTRASVLPVVKTIISGYMITDKISTML
jgi:hypothetical protein